MLNNRQRYSVFAHLIAGNVLRKKLADDASFNHLADKHSEYKNLKSFLLNAEEDRYMFQDPVFKNYIDLFINDDKTFDIFDYSMQRFMKARVEDDTLVIDDTLYHPQEKHTFTFQG